jgi:hypothetical protein
MTVRIQLGQRNNVDVDRDVSDNFANIDFDFADNE